MSKVPHIPKTHEEQKNLHFVSGLWSLCSTILAISLVILYVSADYRVWNSSAQLHLSPVYSKAPLIIHVCTLLISFWH